MMGLGIRADARQGLAGSRKQPGGLSYMSVAPDFVGMIPPCKHPSIRSPRSSLPSLPPLLPMPHLFSAPEVVLAGILAESCRHFQKLASI